MRDQEAAAADPREATCRYCGRDIVFVLEGPGPGSWSAMEREDSGELVAHFDRCPGRERHRAAAIAAKRTARAAGFHGAALDVEIKRIMRESS